MKRVFGAVILYVLAAGFCYAEPYTPAPATVVAKWNPEQTSPTAAITGDRNNPQSAIELANAYLATAGLPGQDRLYGLAEAALKPWVNASNPTPELLVAWARIQQHKHAFDRALKVLDRVLARQPNHISANLLAARIYQVKSDIKPASQYCLKLLGHADLLTVSACTLEVTSFQGKLQQSYIELARLIRQQGLPDDTRGPWLSQILADMAMRLGKPREAIDWLNQPLKQADVSYLAQWADAHLAVNASQEVLDQLGPIVASAPAFDDALLLRLALAEKNLRKDDTWRQHLSERIALRERRQDTQHASDLARYYLDIRRDPKKALHWAKLNWQRAREPNDRLLLEKAIAMNEQTETKTKGKQ